MYTSIQLANSRHFAKAANCYSEHASAQQQSAQALWLAFMTVIETSAAHNKANELASVLDVGAGAYSVCLKNIDTLKNTQLWLLDYTKEMLDKLPNNTRIHKLWADMHNIPLADASMDVVFSNFALHWGSPSVVISECMRVLKVGGYLVLSIPVEGSLSNVSRRYEGFNTFDFPMAHTWLQLLEHHTLLWRQTLSFNIPCMGIQGVMRHLRAVGGNQVVNRSKGVSMALWRQWLLQDAEHLLVHTNTVELNYNVLHVIVQRSR